MTGDDRAAALSSRVGRLDTVDCGVWTEPRRTRFFIFVTFFWRIGFYLRAFLFGSRVSLSASLRSSWDVLLFRSRIVSIHLAILRLARPQPMTIIPRAPRACCYRRRDPSAGRTHQRATRLSSQLTQHSVRTGPLPVYTLLRVCPTPHAVAHGVCECSRLASHRRRCAAPRPTCNHITLAHNARDAPRSTSARTHPRQSSEWGNVSRCARPPPRGLQPCAAAPSIMRVLAILRRASLPPVAIPATSASPHLHPPWRAIAPARASRVAIA